MDWHARFIKVAFAKANRPTQEKFRLIATAQFASVTELLKVLRPFKCIRRRYSLLRRNREPVWPFLL